MSLQSILQPRAVAVVGASQNPTSVSHAVLTNLLAAEFPGPIYPVNPKYQALEGLKCYPNVSALPAGVDLAVICIPAPAVAAVADECGRAGIGGLITITAGFREVGPQGKALEEQLRAVLAKYPGMRMIGPNCLGVISPVSRLNASFAAASPPAGRVAFLSQSGALCTSVLDWARDQQIGFSHFVSIGNMLDVEVADLLEFLADDPHTSSVILYIESIVSGRRFVSAARRFARRKPIVAYKAGRFSESAKAAASHTGAMAGEDNVYETAFRRSGVVRVLNVGNLFDCAELLASGKPPAGDRLAIVTNAGGPGVMATDTLIAKGGRLARLSPATMQRLNAALPPCWSHGNPIDVLGDAPPERFGLAVETVLADEGVDAALVILTPQAMTDPTRSAKCVAPVAAAAKKPVFVSWMGAQAVAEGRRELERVGVPAYHAPEDAIRAFMDLVRYARQLTWATEMPAEAPLEFSRPRVELRARLLRRVAGERRQLLSEREAKELLADYGIAVATTETAATAQEAAHKAARVGFPVVLKVLSPDITHKTDVGGVELNLHDEANVRAAFERIARRAKEARPDARIDGVSVQRMVSADGGLELILGVKKDPIFGPVILVGRGGVATEVFKDHAIELPPLDERLIRRMLESLRCWPLLNGYRGRPLARQDLLVETLQRFSALVVDNPEISEIDANPLLVTPREVIALDARAVLDPSAPPRGAGPYEHLAIDVSGG